MSKVYLVPVYCTIYDKAAKAMYRSGLTFDGTMNELEAWLKVNAPGAYIDLLAGVPASQRRSRKVAWIPYVA